MPALIRTYGLLRDNILVEWLGRKGPRGAPPKLLGSTNPREKSAQRCIDFYPQVGLYSLHDTDKNLIYIGQTGKGQNRLGNRLRSHLSDELMGRWRYFSWFGVGWVPKGTKALKADATSYSTGDLLEVLDPIEGMLINLVEPVLNMCGQGRIGTKWDEGPLDGLGAMIGAWWCADEANGVGCAIQQGKPFMT